VPSLVFRHEERRQLKPIPDTPFDVDDVDTATVTKTFRGVSFDRNRYSVPWRLASQTVLVRAADDVVGVFLGKKQVAAHRRCGRSARISSILASRGAAQDQAARRAGTLPPGLVGLTNTGVEYFQDLRCGGRSVHRETVRLVFLVSCSASNPRDAMAEVMATGHVGAEYVEYVLATRRPHAVGGTSCAWAIRADALSLREPDLSLYDELVRRR